MISSCWFVDELDEEGMDEEDEEDYEGEEEEVIFYKSLWQWPQVNSFVSQSC